MSMNLQEKRSIVLSISLMVLFFIGVLFSTFGLGITLPDCITDSKSFAEGNLIQLDDTHYEVHSVARMWNFDFAKGMTEIVLPVGASLKIYLTSADVVHGFYVDGTTVNMMAVPGQITATDVTFDKPGTYRVLCHEYCGMNHHSMEGRIVVRPKEDLLAASETTREMGTSIQVGVGGTE